MTALNRKNCGLFIKKQKCDYCGVAAPLEDCGIIHDEPQEKAAQ